MPCVSLSHGCDPKLREPRNVKFQEVALNKPRHSWHSEVIASLGHGEGCSSTTLCATFHLATLACALALLTQASMVDGEVESVMCACVVIFTVVVNLVIAVALRRATANEVRLSPRIGVERSDGGARATPARLPGAGGGDDVARVPVLAHAHQRVGERAVDRARRTARACTSC